MLTLLAPLRAGRFLDTTGLTPDNLRECLTDPSTLAATLIFLEAHEPDLIACAEATGHRPESLVAARHALDPGVTWFGWRVPGVLEAAVVTLLGGLMLTIAIVEFSRSE